MDEAPFTSPVVRMTALTEVFGLAVLVVDPTGGTLPDDHLSVQVTIDGETYLTWDGVEWVAAEVDGDYTSVIDFNENCAALAIPDTGALLGFRVRLEALGLDPRLAGFTPFLEWDHTLLLDWMTLAKETATASAVSVERRTQLGAATDAYALTDTYAPDTDLPAKVFNLTTDPARATNLFESWGAGPVLNLTEVQDADSVLMIRFSGQARVTIAQRDELVDITQIPHTIVRLQGTEETDVQHIGRMTDFKFGATQRRARERFQPLAKKFRVSVEHWSASPKESLTGIKALRRAFEVLRSPQTGATWRMRIVDSPNQEVRQGDGIFGGTFMAEVYALDFDAPYTEVPLVRSISILHGTGGRTRSNESIVISAG